MFGITNDQLRGRLLREPELSLAKTIDICRASELSQSQLKTLHGEVEVPVNKVHKQKKQWKKKDFTAQSEKEKSQGDCTRCGHKHEPRRCPAYVQVCKVCHKRNHYARRCNTRTQTGNRQVHEIANSGTENEEMFLGTIEVKRQEMYNAQVNSVDTEKEKWTEKLIANKKVLTV